MVGRRLALRLGPSRVGYMGAQGQGNLGDEVLFDLTRHALGPSRLVPFEFPIRERRLALLRLSGRRYFRSVLLSGGTLINPLWAEAARASIELGVPLWTLGTGVGSCGFYHNEEVDIGEWGPILSHAARIGVRGPLSAERLARLGVPNPIEVVGDVALLLARNRVVPPARPPMVLVNLALQRGPGLEQGVLSAESSVFKLLAGLCARGCSLVLVAMHPTDVPRLRSLAEALGRDDLPVHTPSTGEEFLRLAESALFGVTVRLHAGILACCAGVPVLMLGYRDKCLDFMRSMQLEEWYVDLRDASSGRRIEEMGLAMVEQAEPLRDVVLKRAAAWKHTLLAYIQSAADLYAPRVT